MTSPAPAFCGGAPQCPQQIHGDSAAKWQMSLQDSIWFHQEKKNNNVFLWQQQQQGKQTENE